MFTFKDNYFQMMLTFMQETCNKNIDLLDNFAENGQSFELREMFGKFTMDTIASCAFGLDPQASTHKGPFLYYVSTFRGRGRGEEWVSFCLLKLTLLTF